MSIFDNDRMYAESWQSIANKLGVIIPGYTLLSDAPVILFTAILDRIIKLEKDMKEIKDMDLAKLRETRIPSKLKRELRRKYDKRHKRNAV